MATSNRRIEEPVDSWLLAWGHWVDQWLMGGVAHPSAGAITALTSWIPTCGDAWPELAAKAHRLLQPDVSAEAKAAHLLDLAAWLEMARAAHSVQAAADVHSGP